MRKVLLTGGAGFVGTHLIEALGSADGPSFDVFVTGRSGDLHNVRPIQALDVTDFSNVQEVLRRCKPDHVVHLAGIASPRLAELDPELAWRVHVGGALNIGRAILEVVPDCQLLHIGSGLVYGRAGENGERLTETSLIAPIDQYGLTKSAADLAIAMLSDQGLRAVRVRPFNHAGPGQSDTYALSAFAKQIARAQAGDGPVQVKVGSLSSKRDYLDVRDVVRAYLSIMYHHERIAPGTIYNICSGHLRSMGEILDSLARIAGKSIVITVDESKINPRDIREISGDYRKIHQDLGWKPSINFDQTLSDIISYWKT